MPDGLKMTISVETCGHPYSSKLILSVNEVVITAIKDCFNTTNTAETLVFRLLSYSLSLFLSLIQTHTWTQF